MAHPVGDAQQVEELARLYRSEARRIDDLARRAGRESQRVHWVGRSARRSEVDVRAAGRKATAAASDLRRLASDLEQHAVWIRQTIAELEDLERRIRWWASANPPDPMTPGPDASWISWWPGRHQFSWRDLARQLWSAGAWF